MLGFLRKYQKVFFIIITVTIGLSFSFFGTYNAMPRDQIVDEVVFTAIDGEKIKRSELQAFVVFLGTDSADKKAFGGAWGPNFLNDGVIANEILGSGIGKSLITECKNSLSKEIEVRHQREKHFNFYTHPDAEFLNPKAAWSYFAPNLSWNVEKLQRASHALDSSAVDARIESYLAERAFPAQQLKRVLLFQERNYEWLKPDRSLPYRDLSLFGYHTLEDWFGQKFVRLSAEFVINAAKLAEKKGYSVSKEEALADLLKNGESSFREISKEVNLGIRTSSAYMNEQLRRMGMDYNRAAEIWQKVLLFRRLVDDLGSSVVVDRLTYDKFYSFAKEGVKGVVYHLPEALCFSTFSQLQKLEVYLEAIAKRAPTLKDLLAIPRTFYVAEEVNKRFPELVQQRFELTVAHVNLEELKARISLKEMWNWELEEENFAFLVETYPILSVNPAKTREERFEALEALEPGQRQLIDHKAQEIIVKAHPEWVDEALEHATVESVSIAVNARGGHFPLEGIEDRGELLQLLNEESSPLLGRYTADQRHFYRIKVIEKEETASVMTFQEAERLGVLDELLTRKLELTYASLCAADSKRFRNETGELKLFSEVRQQVAQECFAQVLKAIKEEYKQLSQTTLAEDKMTSDFLASVRFYGYVQKLRGKDLSDPQFVFEKGGVEADSLETQWRLVKEPFLIDRSTGHELIEIKQALTLSENSLSRLQNTRRGDIFFFAVEEGVSREGEGAISSQLLEAQQMMSREAVAAYMRDLIREWVSSKALSLEAFARMTTEDE